ncbi:MAG: sheath polysaccharide-degrading enzyme, partial [Firmicutes bacterium]|nr:sheath polysaccharide-degrading enzyme [Bacillota bacterium]
LYGCEIYNIGMEALHFRDGSSNNIAENLNIHDTGKQTPDYGEGVYVGSDQSKWSTYKKECDYNTVKNSTIGPGVTAEHVDIKEGTTGTVIEGCTFKGTGISGANYADSFIDVKGNNASIRNNVGYRENNSKIVDAFQLHQQVSGWGLNNYFIGNTVYLDISTPYVINAASGTSAFASNNTRNPAGNMYKGNVTVL